MVIAVKISLLKLSFATLLFASPFIIQQSFTTDFSGVHDEESDHHELDPQHPNFGNPNPQRFPGRNQQLPPQGMPGQNASSPPPSEDYGDQDPLGNAPMDQGGNPPPNNQWGPQGNSDQGQGMTQPFPQNANQPGFSPQIPGMQQPPQNMNQPGFPQQPGQDPNQQTPPPASPQQQNVKLGQGNTKIEISETEEHPKKKKKKKHPPKKHHKKKKKHHKKKGHSKKDSNEEGESDDTGKGKVKVRVKKPDNDETTNTVTITR